VTESPSDVFHAELVITATAVAEHPVDPATSVDVEDDESSDEE
jgi:hypothetical protein